MFAGNKIRQKRHEAKMKDMGGARAQANDLKAAPDDEREEDLEEQVSPGIHDKVAGLAEEHGPAIQVHMTHDHEQGIHHVHSIHGDGFENHSDHGTAAEAHMAGAEAAGAPGDDDEGPDGEYPEGHESMKSQKHPKAKSKSEPKDDDDYEVPDLD